MIDKTDGLQVFIDSLGHAGGLAIAVVYEGFDSCILVWINAGIAVDGYEIIGPGFVAFFCFAGRAVIYVGGPCIDYIDPGIF